MLPVIHATRFVLPLREGGSMPGVFEADDEGTWVVKFRGAGQGLKVLVAEIIVGELARRVGLRVPELKVIDVPEQIARYEADEKVQDLLTASLGRNLAMDFLPGALNYDGSKPPSTAEAATILWLDAFTANIDRTDHNPNLLRWHRNSWCIDHGAALYFHYSWPNKGADPERFARQPFDATHHIMRFALAELAAAHTRLAGLIDAALLDEVLALVPEDWLERAPGLNSPDEVRAAYRATLLARLANADAWLPVSPA